MLRSDSCSLGQTLALRAPRHAKHCSDVQSDSNETDALSRLLGHAGECGVNCVRGV